jgi:integrase
VTLHKALEQAVLDGLVPRNIAEGVKAPRVHKEEVKPLCPTKVRALLSAASGDRLEALHLLAIHTGLRQGELLGLKWSDINLATLARSRCSVRSTPMAPSILPKGTRAAAR